VCEKLEFGLKTGSSSAALSDRLRKASIKIGCQHIDEHRDGDLGGPVTWSAII
jgi:hypothetical protein